MTAEPRPEILAPRDWEAAHLRLSPFLKTTALTLARAYPGTSARDDENFTDPFKCHFKWETGQPTGSFKIRPALNGILTHKSDALARGVLTSSSGNFAQAVAYSARQLGCRAHIVMMSSTSPYKLERTRELGAEITLCAPTFEARWDMTARLARETGALLLHPYDSLETLAGDATLALECLDQIPEVPFTVIVPASGGGLLAAVATTLKVLRPQCRVIGAQPSSNGSLKRSWDAGQPVRSAPFKTLADALVAAQPGTLTFELIRRHVDAIVEVSEEELLDAVRVIAREEDGARVEPGGAAGYAALRSGRIPKRGNETVVCVLSGGNVEPAIWKEWTGL